MELLKSFPSLKDYILVLLIVQGLKTVSSHILSGLIVVYGERAKSNTGYSIVAGNSIWA